MFLKTDTKSKYLQKQMTDHLEYKRMRISSLMHPRKRIDVS